MTESDKKVYCIKLRGEPDWFVDPVVLRRELLQASQGSLWAMVAKLNTLQRQLHEILNSPAIPVEIPEHLQGNPLASVFTTQNEAQAASLRAEIAVHEGQLAAVAMQVFGLKPVDPKTGEGHLESDALDALRAYLGYAEKKDS